MMGDRVDKFFKDIIAARRFSTVRCQADDISLCTLAPSDVVGRRRVDRRLVRTASHGGAAPDENERHYSTI